MIETSPVAYITGEHVKLKQAAGLNIIETQGEFSFENYMSLAAGLI